MVVMMVGGPVIGTSSSNGRRSPCVLSQIMIVSILIYSVPTISQSTSLSNKNKKQVQQRTEEPNLHRLGIAGSGQLGAELYPSPTKAVSPPVPWTCYLPVVGSYKAIPSAGRHRRYEQSHRDMGGRAAKHVIYMETCMKRLNCYLRGCGSMVCSESYRLY
jgi:hypothetical protein